MNKSPQDRRQRISFRNALFLFSVLCFLVSAAGCDAFVRKFTRKPKKENLPQEEMVLAPEEYNAQAVPKEELYRQYYLFWKSWHDELVEALKQKKSRKKQVDCAKEAKNNLVNLKELLKGDTQSRLDFYITQIEELKEIISEDTYGLRAESNLRAAERIKRSIQREFSYNKIKNNLS